MRCRSGSIIAVYINMYKTDFKSGKIAHRQSRHRVVRRHSNGRSARNRLLNKRKRRPTNPECNEQNTRSRLGVARITRDRNRADAANLSSVSGRNEVHGYVHMINHGGHIIPGNTPMKAIRIAMFITVVIGLWVACGIIIVRSLPYIPSLARPLSW